MNATLATGQSVGNGRYILNKQLSDSGGTWLAHDEVENKPVVLKFLPTELLQDPRGIDELRNQVNIARELSHPNIGNVYELYESQGEEAFVSMEYVEGMNLPALQTMQPGRVFNWTFLAPLLKQIFAGLQFLHENKIVQGSVKPSSLMLDRKGQLKLLDIGVAGILNNPLYSGPPKSGPGGLLPYLSPKQIEGNLPEVTDDIYSLGVTIFELLTSTPPYYTGDILPQIRAGTPETVEQRLAKLKIANRVPPVVSSMVMACLSKDPAARPQDVETIAKSLEFANLSEPEAQLPVLKTETKGAVEVMPPQREVARAVPARMAKKRSPIPLIAAAVVGVVLIAGGAFWFLNKEKPEEQTQPVAKPPVVENKKPAEAETPQPAVATKPAAKPAEPVAPPAAVSPADEVRAERQAQEAAEIARLAARAKGNYKPAAAPKATKSSSAKETVKAPEPSGNEEGFVSLFNGEDLSGWSGEAKFWSVEDKLLTGRSGVAPSDNVLTCLVWQGGQVDDFELRFSYKFSMGIRTPQAGAGIEYRAKKVKEFDVRGYQFYLSYTGDNTGFLTGRGREGMIAFTQKMVTDSMNGVDRLTKVADLDVTPATIVSLVKKEDWNNVVIIAQGNHLVHMVNGRVVADLTDNNDKKQRSSGLLAIYVTTAAKPQNVIQFKDIRLKKLSK